MRGSVGLIILVALGLPLLSIRLAFAEAANAKPVLASRPWILRLVAVLCLFGPQVIHTAVMEPHLAEWIPAGFFFFGLSLVEGGLGVGLVLAPSRRLCWVAAAVTAATLALWGVSRTMGLPFGPQAFQPETIGRPDLIATLLEVTRVCALLALALGPGPAKTSPPSRQMQYLLGGAVLVVVATLTAVGMNGASRHHHGVAAPSARVSVIQANETRA